VSKGKAEGRSIAQVEDGLVLRDFDATGCDAMRCDAIGRNAMQYNAMRCRCDAVAPDVLKVVLVS